MTENMNGYTKTTRRVVTKRGVLWLGQTCNLRCHFCYFTNRVADKDHPEHPFMSLDKAKHITTQMREVYGNNAIDIQGGEPTIYPEIEALCSHCRDIGLLPSLITNGLVLAKRDRVRRLKDAGVRDMLVSIHGLGGAYDRNVGVPGAHEKQMQALKNLRAEAVPFRFNCVLAKSVLPDLQQVAELAVDNGARVVNFIAFNPFEDQQENRRSIADVPRYAEVSGPLMRAMEALEGAGIEVNVRYFPFCMVQERFRKNIYNFQQLPYDLHEWDYASWSWTGQTPQRMKGGDPTPVVSLRQANVNHSQMFKKVPGYLEADISPEQEYRDSATLRAREHCSYQYSAGCQKCALQNICDGFHGDYASLFGPDEARPVDGEKVDDPLHFCQRQEKIVEKEDYDWAL